MERYKEYMDQISVPDGLHEKCVRPEKKTERRPWGTAVPALLMLCFVLAGGMWRNQAAGGSASDGVSVTSAGIPEAIGDGIVGEQETAAEAGAGKTEAMPEGSLCIPEDVDWQELLPVREDCDFADTVLERDENGQILLRQYVWEQGGQRIVVEVRTESSVSQGTEATAAGSETTAASGTGAAEANRKDELYQELSDRLEAQDGNQGEDGLSAALGNDRYRVTYVFTGMSSEEAREWICTAAYFE